MSAPVLSWLLTAQGKSKDMPCPAAVAMQESTIHLEASSSVCLATALEQGPLYPTLRANPFPKVTDLFCRLPLKYAQLTCYMVSNNILPRMAGSHYKAFIRNSIL